MAKIKAGGTELEYEISGPEDGTPFLFINGFGSQMTSWPHQFFDGLANAGMRVLRFDNRDVGLSQKWHGILPDIREAMKAARAGGKPDVPYTLDEMAADAAGRGCTDRRGVDLELATSATLWKRLSLEARVEYEDLSARAAIALDGLAFDQDVPPAALRAKLRTDGKSAIEGELDGSVGALVPAVKAKLLLPISKPPAVSAELDRLDLAQALAIARRKVGGLEAIASLASWRVA